MRSDFNIDLEDRLHLDKSDPERMRKILQGIKKLSSWEGEGRPKSGKKAGDALVAFMREWDENRNQTLFFWEFYGLLPKKENLGCSLLDLSSQEGEAPSNGRKGSGQAGPFTANRSITQSQAVPSLSDFLLSDHTRNYVSTYRIFAPPR